MNEMYHLKEKLVWKSRGWIFIQLARRTETFSIQMQKKSNIIKLIKMSTKITIAQDVNIYAN